MRIGSSFRGIWQSLKETRVSKVSRGEEDTQEQDGPLVAREDEPQEERGSRAEHDESAGSRQGTSWISVLSGWLGVLGAGLILGVIVSSIIAVISGAEGLQASGGAPGRVGLFVIIFLAFLLGGYVAGRMASRSGVKHGLLVALPALVATVALSLLGSADSSIGAILPVISQDEQQGLGGALSALLLSSSGVLALLLFLLLAGALGGARGARSGRQRDTANARS